MHYMSDVYLADELEQEYSNTIEESEGCFLSEGQEDEEKTEQFRFVGTTLIPHIT